MYGCNPITHREETPTKEEYKKQPHSQIKLAQKFKLDSFQNNTADKAGLKPPNTCQELSIYAHKSGGFSFHHCYSFLLQLLLFQTFIYNLTNNDALVD